MEEEEAEEESINPYGFKKTKQDKISDEAYKIKDYKKRLEYVQQQTGGKAGRIYFNDFDENNQLKPSFEEQMKEKPKGRNIKDIIEQIPKIDFDKMRQQTIDAEDAFKKKKMQEETSDYFGDEEGIPKHIKSPKTTRPGNLKFPILEKDITPAPKKKKGKKKTQKEDLWNKKINPSDLSMKSPMHKYSLRKYDKDKKGNNTEYEAEQNMYENFLNYTNGTQEDEPFLNKTRRYLEKGYDYFSKVARIIHGAGQIYGAYNLIRNFANRPRQNQNPPPVIEMEMDDL